MNRAIDGDVVAVELLPREEWKSSTDDVVVEQDVVGAAEDPDPESAGSSLEEETEQKESRAISKTSKKTGAGSTSQPTGRVVGVIKRNWRPYVCHIDRASIPISALQSSLSAHAVFAMPLSRSVPKIRIRTRQASTLANQKILVSIDRWEPSSRYPEGHFVRALGIVESKDTEQESLLLEHDIPYRPFGKAILDCLPPAGDKWIVPEKNSSALWNDREDFRELMICSIDPPGCQDIDDALHARRLANGNIEVGVRRSNFIYSVSCGNLPLYRGESNRP
jgi:exosome complex exonuclease DIS3/RRP44